MTSINKLNISNNTESRTLNKNDEINNTKSNKSNVRFKGEQDSVSFKNELPQSQKKEGFFEKHWKKIALVSSAAIATATVIYLIKHKPGEIIRKVDKSTRKLRNELTEIYDNIFTESTKSLKDKGISIPRPELRFVKLDKNTAGGYRIFDNSISLDLDKFEKYKYYLTDKSKRQIIPQFYTEETLAEASKQVGFAQKYNVNTLTQNEIKAHASVTLAHEVEHYRQVLILLNHSECGPEKLVQELAHSIQSKNGTDLPIEKIKNTILKQSKFLKDYTPLKNAGNIALVYKDPTKPTQNLFYKMENYLKGIKEVYGISDYNNHTKDYYSNALEVGANLKSAIFTKTILSKHIPGISEDVKRILYAKDLLKVIDGSKSNSFTKY